MHAEYVYRRAFGLTHEQYLDEESEVIEWMIRIDAMDRQIEQEREQRRWRAAFGG